MLGRAKGGLARPRHHLAHIEVQVLTALGENAVERPDRRVADQQRHHGAVAAVRCGEHRGQAPKRRQRAIPRGGFGHDPAMADFRRQFNAIPKPGAGSFAAAKLLDRITRWVPRTSIREDRDIMCRWIAYRGDTVALEHYVTAPVHSLVEQSLRARESAASTNGDGFGLGWYAGHDEPGLYREVRPAWSDENLRHLCRHIRSHLFFAHVRASTGTATTRPNCHPFAHRQWLFMHNGQIGNWSLIRRKVEALIPDAYYG